VALLLYVSKINTHCSYTKVLYVCIWRLGYLQTACTSRLLRGAHTRAYDAFAGVVVSSTSLVEKDWCTGAIVSMKKLIGKYLSMALPHCYSVYKNNR
jgi:hypothetical protein